MDYYNKGRLRSTPPESNANYIEQAGYRDQQWQKQRSPSPRPASSVGGSHAATAWFEDWWDDGPEWLVACMRAAVLLGIVGGFASSIFGLVSTGWILSTTLGAAAGVLTGLTVRVLVSVFRIAVRVASFLAGHRFLLAVVCCLVFLALVAGVFGYDITRWIENARWRAQFN